MADVVRVIRGAGDRLPPLALEPGNLAVYAVLIVAIWAGAQAIDVEGLLVVNAVVIMLILFVCLGGSLRTDPIGSVSIAVPTVALCTASLLSGIESLSLLGFGWIALWSVAGSRLWPWWSSRILRRLSHGSADAKFVAAKRRISALWHPPWPEATQAVWKEMGQLHQWGSPRTAALLDGTYAWWDSVWAAEAPADTRERLQARLAEEWSRFWAPPTLTLPGRRRRVPDRPTRGTRLEFRFPRLEALIAVASPAERARIAASAAMRACGDVGVPTPELAAGLGLVANGEEVPDASTAVSALLRTVRDERDAIAADRNVENAERGEALSRQANALSSAEGALATPLTVVDVADCVYDALRSGLPTEDPASCEALIMGIVGPERAAAAVEVEPAARPVAVPKDASSPTPDGSMARLIARASTSWRMLIALAAAGFVAGVLGTLIRQVARPMWETVLGDNVSLVAFQAFDRVVGYLAVALVAYLILRPWSRRPGFFDFGLLLLLTPIDRVVAAVFAVTEPILAPINPQAWDSLFGGGVDIWPWAPWYGAIFAATLVGTSVVLRLVFGPSPAPLASASAVTAA